MSSTRRATSNKRAQPEPPQSLKKKPTVKAKLQDDSDPDDSSDLKGLMSALQKIREKAQEDGRKKKEESISSVSKEVKSKIDELKSKLEKERQNFSKALSKSSKECENILKDEAAKFEELHKKFMKDKADHLQGLKDTVSKFEEDKERLYMRYEQLRKKEKTMITEQENFCNEKLAQLEESLKKKKRDDKTFSILRKTLGSMLENEASDEEFPPDE
ncbi:PREDICTED: golgin subfamily A member 6B-like isoform X2 [Camelina sativa]|uniref:Golgin subfamily A member 6B-like isoform X1 n=1 Tax=Camelina sativa TaxID=90675 RepID=A0ABM1R3U1_CAMSA|nr:PREDICTED: golgin subfamily A member 6B-like isoform X1 [Camelina sativa]XP_019093679.1 PREDICTED: golgin subfamily A member 6B-like isoform X2 [Camelina sativa]